MTIGRVTISEVDGQLGAINSDALPLSIAGTAIAGSFAPRLFARLADMLAEYTAGNLLEAGAVQLKDYQGPVLACRIQTADTGSASVVTTGWTGTSTPTIHAGAAPSETAEYRIRVGAGGTRGTEGITYQVSYDAGRNYGPLIALGTATAITFAAATVGTVVVDFGAGTMIAGEVVIVRTVAPAPTAAEVSAAVDKLGQHVQDWEDLEIACPIDATIASAVDTSVAAHVARGKPRHWYFSARLQTPGETTTAYLTSITAAWTSYSSLRACPWAGDMWFVSRVDGRKMRRPRVWATAPYIARLPRQIDPAQLDNGTLPGVSLVDDFGNMELHDEKLTPGLDAIRFGSLYSEDGVFIGNARIRSPEGSDYRYIQIRRVIDIGERLLFAYLRRVLSKDVIVSVKTGKMTPSYVRRLKEGAEKYVKSTYQTGPMVSGCEVNPDANANVLSTEEVPFDFEVIPLGYIKSIPVRVLMKNPAIVKV